MSRKLYIFLLTIILVLSVILMGIIFIQKYDDNLYLSQIRNEYSHPVEITDVTNYFYFSGEQAKLYEVFITLVQGQNQTSYLFNIPFDTYDEAAQFLSNLSHTKDFYFGGSFDSWIVGTGKYFAWVDLESAYTSYIENQLNLLRLQTISKEIITDDLTEAGILIAINDYIVDSVEYNIVKTDLTSALDGYTRCTGYASLFKALAELNGIRTDISLGIDNQTETGHAWNKVYLYGGESYFDPTYNDSQNSVEYSFMKEEDMTDRTTLVSTTYLLRDGYTYLPSTGTK